MSKHIRKHTVALACALTLIAACEETTPTDAGEPEPIRQAATASPEEVYYNEITRGSYALYRDISLCELVSRSDAAGLYEVTELRGVTEPVPGRSGKREPATYVELELREGWSEDPPTNPVVRIDGGPLFEEDVTEMWEISLSLGEEIGAFLEPPSARNQGFFDLNEFRLFKRLPHGGFSNGQLFTRTAVDSVEIQTWVRTIEADLPSCPVDKRPDRHQN